MSDRQLNIYIGTRRFYRYVIDGDEILMQRDGIALDEEPPFRWRAFLNRASEFTHETRWRCFEAARQTSGRVDGARLRDDIDAEISCSQAGEWSGMAVPEDIDQLFGGLTMADWVGPRTLGGWLEEQQKAAQ